MNQTGNIRILLVDDHAVVRAGFKLLLATVQGLEVCGEADRGEQAIQQFPELKPDILIMDLSMPGIGGLETIRRLKQRYPESKVLVFSVHQEQVYVSKAISVGANGYITKNSAPEILQDAIFQIVRGRQYIESGLLKGEAAGHYQQVLETFSSREFDIFRLIGQGYSSHKIAEELCLSYKTVANYTTQIKKKLQVQSVAEMMQLMQNLDF